LTQFETVSILTVWEETLMRGPSSTKIYSERYLECQEAILPHVIAAMLSSPSGICDVETVLEEILPEALEAGWQRRDVVWALRLIGRAKVNTSQPDWELAINPVQHAGR
jgi:hypothetical protein